MFRSAASVHPMRSPKLWCFSHPMTVATSRERNCSWMAVSHKCRPSLAGGHGIKNGSSAPHFLLPSANWLQRDTRKCESRLGLEKSGGEGGIRTPGRGFGPYNGLANRPIKPLWHLSSSVSNTLAQFSSWLGALLVHYNSENVAATKRQRE